MNKPKKTEAEKKLIKFRNQLHNLLIKYPEIRLAGDQDGDVLGYIHDGLNWQQIYMPTAGTQELIVKH